MPNVDQKEFKRVINGDYEYFPEQDQKWILQDRKFLLTALETRNKKIAELEKRLADLEEAKKLAADGIL